MKKVRGVLLAAAVLVGCGTIPHQVRTDVIHDLTLGTISIETVNISDVVKILRSANVRAATSVSVGPHNFPI